MLSLIVSFSLIPPLANQRVSPPWDMLAGIVAVGGFVFGLGACLVGTVFMVSEAYRFLAIGMWQAGQDLGLSFAEIVPPNFNKRFGAFRVFQVAPQLFSLGPRLRTCNLLSGQIDGHRVEICHVIVPHGDRACVATAAIFSDVAGGNHLYAPTTSGNSVEFRDGCLAVWRDLWAPRQLKTLVIKGQSEAVRQSVHELLAGARPMLGAPRDDLRSAGGMDAD